MSFQQRARRGGGCKRDRNRALRCSLSAVRRDGATQRQVAQVRTVMRVRLPRNRSLEVWLGGEGSRPPATALHRNRTQRPSTALFGVRGWRQGLRAGRAAGVTYSRSASGQTEFDKPICPQRCWGSSGSRAFGRRQPTSFDRPPFLPCRQCSCRHRVSA